jgi:hypothetical protein
MFTTAFRMARHSFHVLRLRNSPMRRVLSSWKDSIDASHRREDGALAALPADEKEAP